MRERAGQESAETVAGRAEQATVPKWRPDVEVSVLPRDYPKIAETVRAAGTEGVRAIEVHRRLDWPDNDGSRQSVRNRLQRLAQKGWLRLVSRGVYAWPARPRSEECRPRRGGP
ncbi:hypothetical protein [Streptomyces sp. NPDC094468]|uniref:hypothetical protein n=1 Tax=Streptomyces sp. NPDC094468 TaxID=3366066 RepID=UPI0038130776